LVYDSTNNALYVVSSDGSTAANFYATGGNSALGYSPSGSGGSGTGDVTWAALAAQATNNRTIHSSYIADTLANYLLVSGGTVTGDLTLLGNVFATTSAFNINHLYLTTGFRIQMVDRSGNDNHNAIAFDADNNFVLSLGTHTAKIIASNLLVGTNTVWHGGNFPLAISSPTSGQVLKFNGTSWVNDTIPASGGTVTSITLIAGTGISLDVDNTAITTSGSRTVNISSTYQTYISHGESAYNSLGNYLLKSGGTISGNLIVNGSLNVGDPVTFGDVLTVYDEIFMNVNERVATENWVGQQGFALASAIPTNNNQLTNGAGYITASALNGYATETWVANQDYVSTSDLNTTLSGYLPLSGGRLTGSLTLYNSGGGATPYLLFQRGTQGDYSYDWRFYDKEGYLYLDINNGSWNNVLFFLEDGIYAVGGYKYATQSWVQSQGYITSSSISDMATMTWVANQDYVSTSDLNTTLSGYATTSDLGNYLPLSGGSMNTGASIRLIGDVNYPLTANDTIFPVIKIGLNSYLDSGHYVSAICFSNENYSSAGAWYKGFFGYERTGSYDKGDFVWGLNNTENGTNATYSDVKMRLDKDGNLGIGRTPSYTLDVNGTIRATGNISTDQGYGISSGSTISAAGNISSGVSVVAAYSFERSARSAFNGSLIIGAGLGDDGIYYEGSSGDTTSDNWFRIGSRSSVFIYADLDGCYTTNFAKGIHIDRSGYIGIGARADGSNKLYVGGNLCANGGITTTTGNSIASGGNITALAGYMQAAQGFKKTGSDDQHVLLGAGGHKAVSDFITNPMTSDLILSTTGNITPYIRFQRGTYGDSSYDWAINNNDGKMHVSVNTGGEGWTTRVIYEYYYLALNSSCDLRMYDDSTHYTRIYANNDGLDITFANSSGSQLYVNGDVNATELYEDSVRVATRTWVTSQGYITGSYLPLSGGTMNTGATINLVGKSSDYTAGAGSVVPVIKVVLNSYGDYAKYVAALQFANETLGRLKGFFGYERTGSYDRGDFVWGLNNTENGTNATYSDIKMRLDKDGNLGIGVSPSYKLDVNGTICSRSMFKREAIYGAYGDLVIGRATGGDDGIYYNSTANMWFRLQSQSDILFSATCGTTASATRYDLYISCSNGYVGIGTSSPSYKLHVDGDIYSSGTIYGTVSYSTNAGYATSAGNASTVGNWSVSDILSNSFNSNADFKNDANTVVTSGAYAVRGSSASNYPSGFTGGECVVFRNSALYANAQLAFNTSDSTMWFRTGYGDPSNISWNGWTSFLTNPMTTHLSFNSGCDIRMYNDSTHYIYIHEDSDGLNIGFAHSNSNDNLVVSGGIENTGSVTVGNTLTVNGTTTSVGNIYGSSNLYLEGDLYIHDIFPQGGGAFYWYINGNGYGVMTVSGGTAVAFSCKVDATSFSQTSDARKKNISDYDVEPNLWDIAYAPAIRYTWKEGRDKANHVGSLAQYWKAILPEAVTENYDGYLGMQYDVIALLSAISIAKKTVEHERRISELERENAILRNRIETLEAA